MAKLTKFPDTDNYSCVYYAGMDAILLQHRTSGDGLWINGSDIDSLEEIFQQVQVIREERHASVKP